MRRFAIRRIGACSWNGTESHCDSTGLQKELAGVREQMTDDLKELGL